MSMCSVMCNHAGKEASDDGDDCDDCDDCDDERGDEERSVM